MGVKTPPRRGPKRVIFGVWGSGGPRSRVWDPRFGVWETPFWPFLTSIWGRPSGGRPSHQTAPSLWILEGSRPLKRVDFGSFLGHFWPLLRRPLEGALPSSDDFMDVSGPRPENRQKIAHFSPFFEQFLRLVGKEGERGWFLFRFQTLFGSKICSPK